MIDEDKEKFRELIQRIAFRCANIISEEIIVFEEEEEEVIDD